MTPLANNKLTALMKPLLIGVSSIGLMACQPDTSDLEAFVTQVNQNTQVNIEPYPEFVTKPPFKYQAGKLRSPFLRPKNQNNEAPRVAQKNCLQPDFQRSKQALESYGIDSLTIKGSFSRAGKNWALVAANDGSLHKVSVGDYMGLFHGRVTAIGSTQINYVELLPDGTGCWQVKQATLSLSSSTGEEDNV